MKNFFNYLTAAHIKAINRIKRMIDVDAKEYPKYREERLV